MLHLKHVLGFAALLLAVAVSASLETETRDERLIYTRNTLEHYCANAYKPKSAFFTRESGLWQDFNERILARLFCGSPDGNYNWVKGKDPCTDLTADQRGMVYEVYRATSERGIKELTTTLYDVCRTRSEIWRVVYLINRLLKTLKHWGLAQSLHQDALKNPNYNKGTRLIDDTIVIILNNHLDRLTEFYNTPMSLLFRNFFPRHHLNTYFARLGIAPKGTLTIYEDVLGMEQFEALKTASKDGKCGHLTKKHELSWNQLQTVLAAEWTSDEDYDKSDKAIFAFEEGIRELYKKCVSQPEEAVDVEGAFDDDADDVPTTTLHPQPQPDPVKEILSSASTKSTTKTIGGRRYTLIAIGLLIVGVLMMVAAAAYYTLVDMQSMESLIE